MPKWIPALTLEEFHQQLVDGTYAPEVMMEMENFRGGHIRENAKPNSVWIRVAG